MSDDNVFQMPTPGPRPHGIPVFDMPRPETGLGGVGERHIQDSCTVTMTVYATDAFIDVPVRAVYVDDGLSGWALEIGPYSIQGRDACKLANMLERYGRLSQDFRRADSLRGQP